ncbi:MAG: L-lactate permease [Stygiobacter sp.]|nr:MAG: L-lactate permease [Stygiobacter sp.]
MGTQQALGVLMEEFVLAAFDEVKDAWKNGFIARVDDGFLAALKERLMRVAARVLAKWREALTAFKDGSISGFLSNLVTVIINMFFTTSARLVRVIREGFMSLYRAFKMLICPPEGMSFAEAADAATKLLAAGCVTGVGVMLEEWIEKSLLFLGPLAPYASMIVSALVTGLGTVFVTYMLERLDLFGVQAKSRHDEVMAKLNEMVCISYEKALEDTAIFGEPALLHLT